MTNSLWRHAERDQILVHSRGGIGNQLFILAGGLALADHLDCPLAVDDSLHQRTPSFPFLLNDLVGVADASLQRSVVPSRRPRTLLAQKLNRAAVPWSCTFREHSFSFDPRLFDQLPGSCIFGYLQSWRYLERLDYSRTCELRNAILRLAGTLEIPWRENDMVLHVRRGDYLSPGVLEIHGVLGPDYYRAAISKLRHEGFSGDVWVVSEHELTDTAAWHELVGVDVRQLDGGSLWHDLALLIAAPSLVIANSTFSWMGAWFGGRDRPVVAPEPWFRTDAYDTSDLIPPWWSPLRHDFSIRT